MDNAVGIQVERTGIKAKSKIREYVETILWAVVLALIIRTCVVQSFIIPSGSMEDTLLIGDRLFVNMFVYGIKVPLTNLRLPGIREPKRGDVIVFRYPGDRSKDFIKRLTGVPGDEIRIRDKRVYVNGTLYQNLHEVHRDPQILNRRDNYGPVQVPANSYFVMGDNRDNSYDSRFWGFVRKGDLVGLASVKYWSWDQDGWRVRWQRIGKLID